MGTRKFIFVLYLLLHAQLAFARLCPRLVAAVADFAYTNQKDRTALGREFFRVLKNDPLFLPWALEHYKEFPGMAEAMRDYAVARRKGINVKPIPHATVDLMHDATYESDVLRLRAGDTITFGEKKFRLGRFLGAGNASHVYELVDRPGEVIKVPFFFKPGQVKTAREFARRMKSLEFVIDADVKRAKVTELGEGDRYVIMTKVKGHEDGRDFLNEKYFHQPEKHAARERLLQDAVKKVFGSDELPPREQYIHAARQFLWDGKDWILVDWE